MNKELTEDLEEMVKETKKAIEWQTIEASGLATDSVALALNTLAKAVLELSKTK